ncbi:MULTISPECIES: hypothetical protein [unclassified Bartonella]|uniref:hypothetical protein n=1 Tax=unclassified Bartonella TaxID=2645622 RepID=UPI0035CEA9AB
MTKVFKNYVLNIFIVIAFSLVQVVNVNASHLSNTPQKKDISLFVMKQGKKEAMRMDTLYVQNLNYGVGNEAPIEGKIENVFFEPITIGTFTMTGSFIFGLLSGAFMSLFGGIIGIIVGLTR